ncbi:hypothetical protein GIB67_003097 [Kingdonia uniflora]|uniref:Uncharacterized protein n=1 Tax=Kingdonia uniflora TaxID=39325 RepID=A0A7J7N5R9_9MAGN|nr:hypothetical protein GIB67_003097 [Kingdonia uniflora]
MGCSFSGLNTLYYTVNGGGDVWINENRFRIVRQLGEGGFAFVYHVKESSNNDPSSTVIASLGVAKKLKDPSYVLDDGTYAMKKVLIQTNEQLELVKEEIRVSALFCHPNLLPLLDHAIISVTVIKLVELTSLSSALVGLPGVDGLSREQRKRLTIAVELVANLSIVFTDDRMSGLDTRAAAIVMRTIRNIVNTGRTIVYTIHQPITNIFESSDELLFMKCGGQLIYAGLLGTKPQKLVKFFEGIKGVQKIKSGYNPAAWMLKVTSSS